MFPYPEKTSCLLRSGAGGPAVPALGRTEL